MKPDELAFLLAVSRLTSGYNRTSDRRTPRDLMDDPGFTMPWKRACYLLGKWAGKGWYEYGVNLELGWLTPAGLAVAKDLTALPLPSAAR